MRLNTLSVHELSELMTKEEVSSLEITGACLERIRQVEDDIKAFVTVTAEEALQQAREIDAKRSRGEELAPLAGIPLAVKDDLCTAGIKTTCASQILHNYIPPADAAVVQRLKQAGAVLVGKTNMDEFSLGSSTRNSGFFATRNPFAYDAVPGGSSGGSAAAVAAAEAVFAIGSDMAGCIRQPAAFCGIIGMKPTYGYVSRAGLISPASSVDQIGPMARDMTDLALILNAICGHDGSDSTSARAAAPDFTGSLVNDVKGLRIGLPQQYLGADTDPRIAAKVREAARKLEELGAVCDEVSLPHTPYALTAHYIIACAEASSNLARYDGVRHGLRVEAEDVLGMFKKTRSQGFGAEVKRRILLGTLSLSTAYQDTYYIEALKVRTLNRQDFDAAFTQFDCLLTPTAATTAFKSAAETDDPFASVRSGACTVPVNLAGLPALSIPFGMVDGMPVGLQLIARHFDEKTLLRVGYTLEQNTDQTFLKPELAC